MNDCQYLNTTINKYYLQRLLGQSDMSEVFIADDTVTQRQVAVKLQHGYWKGEDARKFLSRTGMVAHLRHPHITPIIDYGIENETAYIVMEYAPEGNLRQRHPKGTRLEYPTIIDYVKQVSDALQFLHDHGLVHRDVKPHNLLIGQQKEIQLSDFGATIASYSIDPASSMQRIFEGTVPYAAPEQLRGKSQRNSDQYAVGVMVYEWICGDWPFNGSFYEITHQHLFVAPPPFKERGISCPSNIERVVMRALEKEPLKRYPSMKRFSEELEWEYKVARARGDLAARGEPANRQQFRSPLPFTEK